ncbi:unnamed protein product [Cyprideis torosa]|uniref:Dynein light chain 1, cytoplasmic n=1 Tax=Cyprideis torosa TaxID=163714 RepID=A0A7R8WH34_9CRUS|nr:unnamed protein product [Cyprideis torosa]CAG0893356.1 unnamed protein product [Cyprideis torosa]
MSSERKAVIKNADMSEEMQQDAVDVANQALEKYNIEKDIAAFIKKEFDRKYNPTWHCIVGRNFGSYRNFRVIYERGRARSYGNFYSASLFLLLAKFTLSCSQTFWREPFDRASLSCRLCSMFMPRVPQDMSFSVWNISPHIATCAIVGLAVAVYVLLGAAEERKPRRIRGGGHGRVLGLTNLGNTCFLNSLLQALASCDIFILWLKTLCDQERRDDESSPSARLILAAALESTLEDVNGSGGADGSPICPVTLLESLRSHGWWIGTEEQDVHEMFCVLLDTLDEETKRSHQEIKLKNLLSPSASDSPPFCAGLEEGTSPVRFDPFFALSLPLPSSDESPAGSFLAMSSSKLSLQGILYTGYGGRPEVLQGTSCEDGCQRKNVVTLKKSAIGRAPHCLCIHLQRVHWQSSQAFKQSCAVTFPEKFALDPYMYSFAKEPEDSVSPMVQGAVAGFASMAQESDLLNSISSNPGPSSARTIAEVLADIRQRECSGSMAPVAGGPQATSESVVAGADPEETVDEADQVQKLVDEKSADDDVTSANSDTPEVVTANHIHASASCNVDASAYPTDVEKNMHSVDVDSAQITAAEEELPSGVQAAYSSSAPPDVETTRTTIPKEVPLSDFETTHSSAPSSVLEEGSKTPDSAEHRTDRGGSPFRRSVKNRFVYALRAAVVHIGHSSSGHFVTLRCRPNGSEESRGARSQDWFYTSDQILRDNEKETEVINVISDRREEDEE